MRIRLHHHPVPALVWLLARFFVVQACKYSDLTPGLVRQRLDQHQYRLLTVDDDDRMIGAATVELTPDSVHIVTLAGEQFSRWDAGILSAFKAIAAGHGKRRITSKGRKGMVRRLAPLGFIPYSKANNSGYPLELVL